MSEQTTTEDAQATATEEQQSDSAADLGDAGKRALDAERAARKAAEKSAAEYAARVKAFEDAQKTDAEKAAEALATAQKDAETARTEALRWRVAAKHGISDEDAETFLTGTDEDTITRQAERLAAIGKTAPAGPRADLTQGSGREQPGSTPEGDFASFLTQQLTGK
jgi:hypothetical protein